MAEPKFSKGEEVEVTIPDEGFRGSWFSATVIRPVAKKNKIHVQYHNLLVEEGKTMKLKEYVEPYNVRPPPPRETNRIFKLYDEVDAYHDDGWWEGDITKVIEEDGIEKFVVYFRVSKEEKPFEPSQLRIHREWINGLWQPPMAEADEQQQGTLSNLGADQNKESSKVVISKGKRSKSEADQTNMMNLRRSTRSKSRADQTNEPSKSGKDQAIETSKLVLKIGKGTSSKSGANQKKESTEAVVNLSKGTPSKSGADKTKVSPKPAVKPRKEMSSKSGTAQYKGASESVVKFNNGTPVEISSDEKGFDGAWFVGTVVETIGENKFLVEHKNLKTDDLTEFLKEEVDSLHIRPAPPEILKDHFKKSEKVDAWYRDAWWTGVISQVDNGPQPDCHVHFTNTGEEIPFKHHEVRPHQEWIRGEWVISSELADCGDPFIRLFEHVSCDNCTKCKEYGSSAVDQSF